MIDVTCVGDRSVTNTCHKTEWPILSLLKKTLFLAIQCYVTELFHLGSP